MRLLSTYLLVAALGGLVFWFLADWNVYLQGTEGVFEVHSRMTAPEQIALSAAAGLLAAGVPLGLLWIGRSSPPGHSRLDRFALVLGVGGAVLGWSLLYLSWRIDGDFWTHTHFLEIDYMAYLVLGLAALGVSQPTALILGLFTWRKSFGKTAAAVPAANLLLFAGVLFVPLLVGLFAP